MLIKATDKIKNAVVSLKKGEIARVQRRVGDQMIKNKEATEVEESLKEYLAGREKEGVRVVIQEREEA